MIFRPIFINGTTLGDTWFQLLLSLWDNGRVTGVDEGSGKGGKRLEFDFATGFIAYPHERPLEPIMPEGIPCPTDDQSIIKYFANYLMDPDLNDNEEYRYATWINGKMKYFDTTITMIDWVIKHFTERGYGNNHCYINVGDPNSNFRYDIPYENETERKTSPCLRGLDFKIKDNVLLLGIYYRSWDLYAGFPQNMGGFTMLSEYVASFLDNVKSGPLMFSSMGLHCYDYQIEVVRNALRKDGKDKDKL